MYKCKEPTITGKINSVQFSLTYIHQWGGLSQLYPSDQLEEKP